MSYRYKVTVIVVKLDSWQDVRDLVFSSAQPVIAGGSTRGGEGMNVSIENNIFETTDIEQARIQSQANARAKNGAVILATGQGFDNWTLRGNEFKGTVGTAVRFVSTKGPATIVGNRFSDIGAAAVQVSGTDGVVIDGNWVAGTAEEGIKVGAGSIATTVRTWTSPGQRASTGSISCWTSGSRTWCCSGMSAAAAARPRARR
jgi:hypothetical protein